MKEDQEPLSDAEHSRLETGNQALRNRAFHTLATPWRGIGVVVIVLLFVAGVILLSS